VVDWLGGVSEGGANVHVQASVRDYMGPLNCENVSRIKAGVGLAGTLSSRSGDIVRVEAPFAANLGLGPAGVFASGGSIGTVRINGDFLGNITAVNSVDIDTVNVDGNLLGSITTNSGTINRVEVDANWGGTISSGGDINNIVIGGVAGVGLNASNQLVLSPGSISTSNGASVATVTVGSDYVGSLSVDGNLNDCQINGAIFSLNPSNAVIPADVTVNGTVTFFDVGNAVNLTNTDISAIADIDFNTVAPAGVIIMDGDFASGDLSLTNGLPQNAFVGVGGEVDSTVALNLPPDGLVGQVVVNLNDDGSSWGGDVVVDSITLSPNYTELSSELGGGQVGVAPFNFHQRTSAPGAGESRDCDPYHTEAVTAAYNPSTGKNDVIASVNIRHYGPVFADGAGSHFRVEFKSDVLPSSWVDRTSLFEIDTSVTGTSALTADRDAVIKGTVFNGNGFTAAGRWRIRPISGKVKCGDVSGNPDVAWDSNVTSGDLGSSSGTQYDWYQFRVLLQAPGGGNTLLQGGTNASDVSAWIDSPYEVNADGETDTTDFEEVVESLVSE